MTTESVTSKLQQSSRISPGFPKRRKDVQIAIFVDRCFPAAVAEALNKAPGVMACHLSDVYGEKSGQHVQDVQWIEDCGRSGWIAVTRNPKIGHTPVEVYAIIKFKTRVFVGQGKSQP